MSKLLCVQKMFMFSRSNISTKSSIFSSAAAGGSGDLSLLLTDIDGNLDLSEGHLPVGSLSSRIWEDQGMHHV